MVFRAHPIVFKATIPRETCRSALPRVSMLSPYPLAPSLSWYVCASLSFKRFGMIYSPEYRLIYCRVAGYAIFLKYLLFNCEVPPSSILQRNSPSSPCAPMIFNTVSQLTLPAAFSHDVSLICLELGLRLIPYKSPCPFQTTLRDLLSNAWIRRPTKRTFEADVSSLSYSKSASFNACIKTPAAHAGQDVRPASKRPKHAS
jgi:hypothetical protein